jgi:hypothetical protein
MKIAVITPYFKEPLSYLERGHKSVITQGADVDHFLVADGFPNNTIGSWNCKHIVLPNSHGDNGNTPRGIGGALAISQGYDAIAYLDADNWFHPGHLSSLIDLSKLSRSEVCTSFRTMHALDGGELMVQDRDELDLTHVDTSCYLILETAFALNDIWLHMPKELSPICDRVFLKGVVEGRYVTASSKLQTVAFRSQYRQHYLDAKVTPPPAAKENVGDEAWAYLSTIDGLRSAVKRLGFVPF